MGSLRSPPLLLLLLLSILSILSFASSQPILEVVLDGRSSSLSSGDDDGLFCDSWRVSVEANNAGVWTRIPLRCLGFVQTYMDGDKYLSDSDVVAGESLSFAETVEISGDGKDVWIFDVDETLLSNLPYYRLYGFGSELFNETSFDEWVNLARAPALPASLRLYVELQGLGFQLVLLTGRAEVQRNATEANLLFSGYHSWERLILRDALDVGKAAEIYKSEKRAELEAQGYRIHGSSGDQWSDLVGAPMATRSFKLPNPMYYVN